MARIKTDIAEAAGEIARRVVVSEGLELVEVEWTGGVLRIFIDREGGVQLADCENVSRQVSAILDVEEVVPADRYQLEVSSPGLDRKLLKTEDFERFAGKKAKVRFRAEVSGRKQATGRITGVEDGLIEFDAGDAESLRFKFEQVAGARLVVEL